jgi:hypothetical protein
LRQAYCRAFQPHVRASRARYLSTGNPRSGCRYEPGSEVHLQLSPAPSGAGLWQPAAAAGLP